MFAYFQTYIRSLSKGPPDSKQHSYKHKHLNFSQNDFPISRADDSLTPDSMELQHRMETDRTQRNSFVRNVKKDAQHKNPYYQGLNRSMNERSTQTLKINQSNMDTHGREIATLVNRTQKQEVKLKYDDREQVMLTDQRHQPDKGGGGSPVFRKQNTFQRSPKLEQKLPKSKQRDESTEEQYQQYLNQTKTNEQESTRVLDNVLRQTLIQVAPEEGTANINQILQQYRKQVSGKMDRLRNEVAPTPQSNLGVTFKKSPVSNFTAIKQQPAQPLPNVHSKQQSTNKKEFKQDSTKLANYNSARRQLAKKYERELTYESERSSTFNENITENATLKDNLGQNHVYRGFEEQKKSPPNEMSKEYERVESSRGINTNIQQFLELNLRSKELKEVQDSLFSRNQFLRSVDLRNNNIAHLPDAICDLTILWKLRLDFNQLTELPINIGNLQRLEVFTCSNNKIKKIPQGFWTIREKLGMLQFNDNLIRKIPKEIGYLIHVKVLFLHNNKLKQIPSELWQLRELQEFSLEWFQYLNPPMPKILKDDRGQLMIKDFQKMCKLIGESRGTSQTRFVHFLSYFSKINTLQAFQKYNNYPKQRNVLHYVALNGHLHLLKDIMKACPQMSVNSCDTDGTSPLILAFKNKQSSIIEYLMKLPITNMNQGSVKYGCPLHIGIRNHEYKLVAKMLKPKYVVNINARDEDGSNAMHFLMSHFGYDSTSSSRIGCLLLKKGIELNALNKAEFSPIHQAIKSFQNKSLKFALEYNQYIQRCQTKTDLTLVKRRQSSNNPFGASVDNQVKKFDLGIRGKNGWTPLHYAVFNNNLIAVEILLHAQEIEQIDMFARDNDNKLPQELCPYNSPIYKLILRRQNLILHQKIGQTQLKPVNSLNNLKQDTINLNKNEKLLNIVHKHINKRSINMKNNQLQSRKDLVKHTFKRANSNDQLIRSPQHVQFQNKGSFRDFHFGINDMSDDEGRQKQVVSFDRPKEASYQFGGKVIMMHSSKTEKNLHSIRLFNQQSSEQKEDRFQKASFKQNHNDSMRRSPRLHKQIEAFPPKQLINQDEDDQIVADFDEIFRKEDQKHVDTIKLRTSQDYMRFMSQPVNFDTQQDLEEMYNMSMSDVEVESLSSDSQLYTQGGKGHRSSTYTNTCILDLGRSPLKNNHSNQPDPNQPFSPQNYQSAPAKEGKVPSAIQVINAEEEEDDDFDGEVYQVSDEGEVSKTILKSKKGKIGSNVETEQDIHLGENEDEYDEADYCDAADEEAEAGVLGQIANKINKFENHNSEVQQKSLNERDALRRFIQELRAQKLRQLKNVKSQNTNLSPEDPYQQAIRDQASRVKNDSQKIPNRGERVRTSDRPFDNFSTNNVDQRAKKPSCTDDEGNVFDTAERSSPQYNYDTHGMDDGFGGGLDQNQVAMRNIKSRQNIFIIGEQEQRQIFKKQLGQNRHTNSAGTLLKLRELNRDCQVYDSFKTNSVDDLVNFLNNPDLAMSEKYRHLYNLMSQEGKNLDEKKMQWLFDNLNEDISAILKADLSYLMASIKNKDFIPSLDSALNKFKLEQKLTIKSPEPTLILSDQVTLKTPNNASSKILGQVPSTHGKHKSQAKQLIVYEASNAYDILRQDVFIQSKQMMEQCNQKINMERERSRERVKLRNLNSSNFKNSNSKDQSSSFSEDLTQNYIADVSAISSQPQTSQKTFVRPFINIQNGTNVFKSQKKLQNAVMNQSNSSIREVPEFVARLNKSPSGPNFKTYGFKYFAEEKNNQSYVMNNASISNDQKDMSQSSSYFLQKQTSFTPKGISGQVFLAFQKQKEISKAIQEEQQRKAIKKRSEYETQIPHYQISLNEDQDQLSERNNAETYNPQKQNKFKRENNPNLLFAQLQKDHSASPIPLLSSTYKTLHLSESPSLNNSISQFVNVTATNTNMASIIQNTLNDANNQKELRMINKIDKQLDENLDTIEEQNTSRFPQKVQSSSSKNQNKIKSVRENSSQIKASNVMTYQQQSSKKILYKNNNPTNSSLIAQVNMQINLNIKNIITTSIETEPTIPKRGLSNREKKPVTKQTKRNQNKFSVNKMSPRKLHNTQDSNLESRETRPIQPQYMKYSKRHLQAQEIQQQQQMKQAITNQMTSILAQQQARYVKHVKYNLSDTQNSSKMKKSISTSKLGSTVHHNDLLQM